MYIFALECGIRSSKDLLSIANSHQCLSCDVGIQLLSIIDTSVASICCGYIHVHVLYPCIYLRSECAYNYERRFCSANPLLSLIGSIPFQENGLPCDSRAMLHIHVYILTLNVRILTSVEENCVQRIIP